MNLNELQEDILAFFREKGICCEYLVDKNGKKNIIAEFPQSNSGERAVRFWIFFDAFGGNEDEPESMIVNMNAVVAREIPREKYREVRIVLNELNKGMKYARLLLDEEENFVFARSQHLLIMMFERAEDCYEYLTGTLEDIRRVSSAVTGAAGLPEEKEAINPTVTEALPVPENECTDVAFYDTYRNIKDVVPFWKKTMFRENVSQCEVTSSWRIVKLDYIEEIELE